MTTTETPISQDSAQAMAEQMARIAVAVGRSKDGTGQDVDWFELAGDVEDMAKEHAELIETLRNLADSSDVGASRKGRCIIDDLKAARTLLRKVAP